MYGKVEKLWVDVNKIDAIVITNLGYNMGFHKRYINNDQIVEMYARDGMQKVYDWYTKGVDAVITETGLASDVYDLIGTKDDWDKMSELISEKVIGRLK